VLALQETQAAAHALGLTLHSVDVREPGEIDLALSVIGREPPDALVLLVDAMIHSQRAPIIAFAIRHRLPTISAFRDFAEGGRAHGLRPRGARPPPTCKSTRSSGVPSLPTFQCSNRRSLNL
jgi:hypothetical protein